MQEVELNTKKVIKYAALPGIFPRLSTLFGGFSYLPFFIATIYKNVGLLSRTHPYLNPDNTGRFGITALVSAAAHELTWDKKNIDRIILFGVTILTLVIFALFGLGLAFSFLSQGAHAAVAFGTILITPSPATDIAFELLDRIFGVPGVYNSGYAAAAAAFPTPFQTGLHAILAMYNVALFIFAGFVFLYYVVSIVGEVALTGTPFGRRFNIIWGPLRLVMALGLLVPMGAYGLNSAQYTLLYVAKFGSSMATNAWLAFNASPGVTSPFGTGALTVYQGDDYQYVDANGNNLALVNPSYNGNPTYQSNGLIIHPKTPDVSPLIAHINLIQTCVFAYKQMFNYDIRPYFIRTTGGASISQPVLSAPGVANVADAVAFYGPGDFYVYFGHHSVADYDKLAGNVRPYCGSMIFSYKNFTLPQLQTSLAGAYYETVLSMFSDANPLTPSPNSNGRLSQAFGYKAVAHKLFNKGPVQPVPVGCPPSPPLVVPAFDFSAVGPCADGQLSPNHRAFSSSEFTRAFNIIIDNAVSGLMAIAPSPFAVSALELNRGWATAGIWYNKLSEWNGDVITGVAALPLLDKYPEVMEKTKAYKIAANPNTDPLGIFKPVADGVGNVQYENEKNRQIATVLNDAYDYWNADGAGDIRSVASKANPLEGGLAAIFGLTPIMTIRDQDHVHPLAQLAGIGRTLIENAITNLTLAAGASFMAGTLGAANNSMSHAFSGMSGFFVALSFVGILLGVVLFYILPFMPFLYTFFAASGWIKSIFEGMVGVPLWALSHLKIKGDGLLSREATAGYYLLLEIFIRPTLILFGLVASTAIFAASVTVLNSVFDLVTDQITGVGLQQATINDPLTMGYYRNNVDQFFFLVLYIIIVYLMGTSAFKLVDQIPHSVIRWINAGVKSFGDMAKDPAEGLYQYASMATYRFGPKLGQGIAGASEALGESVGGATGLADVFKPGNLPSIGSLANKLGGNIGKGSVE